MNRILREILIVKVSLCMLSQLCPTPWTVACQAPLSMGFSRQEYWSGLPFPASEDLPNPGIEPPSLAFPALAGGFFTTANTKVFGESLKDNEEHTGN